ncbi:conserved hypothetical protein (putative transposase or invertase) [Gracilibacillus ureilyticus]|uniref:Transposase (putative) YhgA-like domain-containing protein n=2 Tax=Gracilibacillus ureilyticus TaxID=531814 RepID=A0A1H9U7S7_9BACI|nr:conserved hypothetical protein (putative transposase or invertase) [Gracilibacillus ureilyticus]
MKNPHDKFFKETFSNVDVFKDFIKYYAPESIAKIMDYESIEPQKDSFISNSLDEFFSDLLFKLKLNDREGYIYLLLEHKSYPSRNTAFQLLQYMIAIWRKSNASKGSGDLPVILPLVLFHGEKNWHIPRSFGELLEGFESLPKEVKQYVPNFEYVLCDVSKLKDEDIRGAVQLKIILTLFRDIMIKTDDELIQSVTRSLSYLTQLEDQDSVTQYLETMIRYVWNVDRKLTNQHFHDMIHYIENHFPERSELSMSIADMLREEGRKEGKAEGIEEAKITTLVEVAVKLINKHVDAVPPALEKKLYKQDEETLNQIIDQATEADNMEEIYKLVK